MVYYCNTISSYPDATGVMPLLYSIRDCVPIAYYAILFSIFFILFAAQYSLIKNRTGRAKVFTALLSSSFVVTILSLFLLLSQLITYKLVLLWTFITIVSFIVLIISDNY